MSAFAGGFILVHSRIGTADDLHRLRILRPVSNTNARTNVLKFGFTQLTFNVQNCRPQVVFVTLLGNQGKFVTTKPITRDAIPV
jgi:hypothetical protein